EHQGNTTAAAEEVAEIRALLGELLETGAWIDAEARRRPLTLDDLLIVAPYNAQVADLVRALPRGARVGTVDRFQGQQAPIVIVSMTTSAPEDAPRGMEFLYSLDRLNVATSRAPTSEMSQPNSFRIDFTSSLAPAWLPQMNIVGGPPGSAGSTMKALPTHENALTNRASGARRCSFSISESSRVVKKWSTPWTGGWSAIGLVVSITVLPRRFCAPLRSIADSAA